jgi:hypothetical protein
MSLSLDLGRRNFRSVSRLITFFLLAHSPSLVFSHFSCSSNSQPPSTCCSPPVGASPQPQRHNIAHRPRGLLHSFGHKFAIVLRRPDPVRKAGGGGAASPPPRNP